VLPAGTGKNAIAFMLILHFLQSQAALAQELRKAVIFLAPTTSLVRQLLSE